ncbi:MAG: NfeD family protein [Bryobacteraceae bacterium]
MLGAALADPNVAFLLLVVGALGVYWEVHAPGMVLPGVLGVLLICTGAYGIYQDSPTWYGLTLLVLAIILLTIELTYYTHMVSGVAGTILLAFGALALIQGPRRITPGMAIAISAAFGIITIFLGLLGMRARKSKQMTGIETLVGEIGVSRTEINPEGTVFVRGEYWRAHSGQMIAAGQRVSIKRVEGNLILYVEAI